MMTRAEGIFADTRFMVDPSTAKIWLHVFDRYQKGKCPQKRRFSEEDRDRFTDFENAEEFDSTRERSAGRAAFRRLSSSEYENAVRDLLHLQA